MSDKMKNKRKLYPNIFFCFLSFFALLSSGCIQKETSQPNVTATTSMISSSSKASPMFLCENAMHDYIYTGLVDVNGTLFYVVKDENKPLASFIAGESTVTDNSRNLIRRIYSDQSASVNGKLAYRVIETDPSSNYPKYYISYEGWYYGKKYASVDSPTEVGGKLAYLAEDIDGFFVVYDNEEAEKRYSSVTQLKDIGGKLAYTAGDASGKQFIVYDGEEIGKQYRNASFPTEVNGKLAYVAQLGLRRFIVYDGKETGSNYDGAYSPADVGGELAYVAKRDDNEFIVYKGKEIGVGYDRIFYLGQAQGKLIYVASKRGGEFIVYEGKEGRDFDRITSEPLEIGGAMVFAAKFNGRNCIVSVQLGD